MSNPYQSPQFASSPQLGDPRDKLRSVAKYQQWVIYALLVNIVTNIVAMVASNQDNLATTLGIGVFALVVAIFAMVAIFLLARELYNVGIGVVSAILMIVPCISLITLLIVNGKATSYLQQHGVKVGFMGVDPNKI